jgi:dTDP-4-dehydrorhamnose 3,5-epimerase
MALPSEFSEVTLESSSSSLVGVIVKPLQAHGDPRGFFCEVIRHSDPLFEQGFFGQWSHSLMQHNVVKAWHYHHVQTDWWYVPVGGIETVLFDNREESPTYKKKMVLRMGAPNCTDHECLPVCVRIPPGVLHGCQVLTSEAHLIYITSHTYNPEEEGRFPFNSPLVGHQWRGVPITVENDRRTFVPTSTRALLV